MIRFGSLHTPIFPIESHRSFAQIPTRIHRKFVSGFSARTRRPTPSLEKRDFETPRVNTIPDYRTDYLCTFQSGISDERGDEKNGPPSDANYGKRYGTPTIARAVL